VAALPLTVVFVTLVAMSLPACTPAPASSAHVNGVRVVRAQVRGIT
jgi:hypothetical protein